jgi:hypothetical protein
MKHLLTTLALCYMLIMSAVYAQDLMYLKNTKTPIKVKVYEIGLDEIKYRPYGDTVIPILVLPRLNVSKLVLENGSVFEFKDNPMTDASNYADQHPNAFKFHFLSPLFSNCALSYERSIKPGRSYEAGIGIIGIGVQYLERSPRGLYGRFGYKFIVSPDSYVRGMRYAHILKGGYIKPEIVFGGYGINRKDYYSYYNSSSGFATRSNTYRSDVTFGGLMMNLGKQWVVDDAFVFDMYLGFGFGMSKYTKAPNGSSNYYDDTEGRYYHYAFLGGVKDFPLALSAGFKMGFVFGKQQGQNTVKP